MKPISASRGGFIRQGSEKKNEGKKGDRKQSDRRGGEVLPIFLIKVLLRTAIVALVFIAAQAKAQDEAPADTQVGLYYNYFLGRYTNTPLLIRRDCKCQLGYQSGVGVQKRIFWGAWLNLHTYVLGGTPGAGESNEEFGNRIEGQYRFDRITFLIGLHNEWNVDRPSNFPAPSQAGNTVGTEGLRETYIGFTWWIK